MIAVISAVVAAGILTLSYNHYKMIREKTVNKEKGFYFAWSGIQRLVYEYQKSGLSEFPTSGPVIVPSASGTWESLSRTVKIVAGCKKDIPSTYIDASGFCTGVSVDHQSGACTGMACQYYYPGRNEEYKGKLKPGEYVVESTVDY